MYRDCPYAKRYFLENWTADVYIYTLMYALLHEFAGTSDDPKKFFKLRTPHEVCLKLRHYYSYISYGGGGRVVVAYVGSIILVCMHKHSGLKRGITVCKTLCLYSCIEYLSTPTSSYSSCMYLVTMKLCLLTVHACSLTCCG